MVSRLTYVLGPLSAEDASTHYLFHRRYPASPVLRASPPVQAARPVPHGRPVEGHAPSPHGFPVLRSISVYRHAVVITPVARWALIARGTAYSNRFPVPSGCGLPHPNARSASTLVVSRPAERSLALRPVGSPSRHATSVSKAPTVSFPPHVASIATGWSDPDAGWELHPLKIEHIYTAHTWSDPRKHIKALKAANTIEATPQRDREKLSSAEEPITARIRRRTEARPASDEARTDQNSSTTPQMAFQERIAMERQRKDREPSLP
jgi:hypothetical protein